jgi:hypothetical protein
VGDEEEYTNESLELVERLDVLGHDWDRVWMGRWNRDGEAAVVVGRKSDVVSAHGVNDESFRVLCLC